MTNVQVKGDVKTALAAAKPLIARYLGGMGHPKLDFYKERMMREGFGEAAHRIEELFRAGSLHRCHRAQ